MARCFLLIRWNAKRVAFGVLVFLFFAPVVPTSVSPFLLLPSRNQCTGLVRPSSVSVWASISYVGFGLLIAGTMHEGWLGLVYVPNNGIYTIQFPPLGFENIMCG